MLQAVLFDLDGVLIDSREVWFHLLDGAARSLGFEPISRDAFEPSFGQGVEADRDRFFPGTPIEVLETYFRDHFLDHRKHLSVDPEAAGTLDSLRRKGIRTAIVTNTEDALARATLASIALAPDAIVGKRAGFRSKPAPDLVTLALETLGIDRRASFLVGDSRFDREAASAAGVDFVGYRIEGARRIETLRQVLELV